MWTERVQWGCERQVTDAGDLRDSEHSDIGLTFKAEVATCPEVSGDGCHMPRGVRWCGMLTYRLMEQCLWYCV